MRNYGTLEEKHSGPREQQMQRPWGSYEFGVFDKRKEPLWRVFGEHWGHGLREARWGGAGSTGSLDCGEELGLLPLSSEAFE